MKKGRRARDKIQLRVLNPRGKIVQTVRVMPARRLQTLNQKKIAVLINTQSGKHDRLISALEDRLKRRFPGIELETWRIPYALPLGQKKPVLERIADQSDAVVGLMGIPAPVLPRRLPISWILRGWEGPRYSWCLSILK